MDNKESGNIGGSEQTDQTTDQGTIAITRATEFNAKNLPAGCAVYPDGSIGYSHAFAAGEDEYATPAGGGNTTSEPMRFASEVIDQLQPAPRQISETELRELRRLYFTIRHDRVEECGHRFDRINEPRTNCEWCYFHFFESHPELVKTADRAYIEQGRRFLDKMRGKKFRVYFTRYMATKLKLQQEQEQEGLDVKTMQSTGAEIREISCS